MIAKHLPTTAKELDAAGAEFQGHELVGRELRPMSPAVGPGRRQVVPREKTATVHRLAAAPREVAADQTIDVKKAPPGFACCVGEFFQ